MLVLVARCEAINIIIIIIKHTCRETFLTGTVQLLQPVNKCNSKIYKCTLSWKVCIRICWNGDLDGPWVKMLLADVDTCTVH